MTWSCDLADSYRFEGDHRKYRNEKLCMDMVEEVPPVGRGTPRLEQKLHPRNQVSQSDSGKRSSCVRHLPTDMTEKRRLFPG